MRGTEEAIADLMDDTGMTLEESTLAYEARVAKYEAIRRGPMAAPVLNRAHRRAMAKGRRA